MSRLTAEQLVVIEAYHEAYRRSGLHSTDETTAYEEYQRQGFAPEDAYLLAITPHREAYLTVLSSRGSAKP